LNPLEPLSGNNGYFMELLYRSLHTYDNVKAEISPDIASCDTSSLSKIECFIEE
jgi:MarR-like DNA-binding transcriptional regulator SgrR of sgrS sRNA